MDILAIIWLFTTRSGHRRGDSHPHILLLSFVTEADQVDPVVVNEDHVIQTVFDKCTRDRCDMNDEVGIKMSDV